MRKTRGPWTAAEDRLLDDLHAQGHPLKKIARRIGRSIHSVKTRRSRREFASVIDDRLRSLLTSPHTIPDVMATTGLSKRAVGIAKQRLRLAGVPVLPATWADSSGRIYQGPSNALALQEATP